MNLVGSGCWKTFNFKSMKSSKSSSVKPSSDDSSTGKESKKGSKDKDRIKQSESKALLINKTTRKPQQQSQQPQIVSHLRQQRNGSLRETSKIGSKGGGRGGGGGGISGQLTGSKGISSKVLVSVNQSVSKTTNSSSFSSTGTMNTVNMVTSLRRAASFPLIDQATKTSQTTTVTGNNQSVGNNPSEMMFKFFDVNGRGFIGEDELIQMMASLGEPITRSEAKLMILEADSKHDGKIDLQEFRDLVHRLPLSNSSTGPMSLQEAFKIFDEDADGSVNLEEVKLIMIAIGASEDDFIQVSNQWKSFKTTKTVASTSSSPPSRSRISENNKINFNQLKDILDSVKKITHNRDRQK